MGVSPCQTPFEERRRNFICGRLSFVETCGQQPYTELRYVFMFIGYFSRLAGGWEFFALAVMVNGFDKNGKISIFMWRIRDKNM